MSDRGLVDVLVSPAFMADLLTEGNVRPPTKTLGGIPEDATLVAVMFDGRTITLRWEHPLLPIVLDGDEVPRAVVVLLRLVTEA